MMSRFKYDIAHQKVGKETFEFGEDSCIGVFLGIYFTSLDAPDSKSGNTLLYIDRSGITFAEPSPILEGLSKRQETILNCMIGFMKDCYASVGRYPSLNASDVIAFGDEFISFDDDDSSVSFLRTVDTSFPD